ncbi:two-component system capsular synthesis sensor histidine kinase, partial [Burkholderia sp. TJI49]
AAAVASSAALRVLLADDASVNGTILREQLDVLGCTVRVAGLGRTALDLLDADEWDLLLIGTDLPDMKAVVLAQTARLRHVSCDVVIVTSHLMPDDARGYAAAGVECVLTKPVTLARLRGVLTSVAHRSGRHVGGAAMQT